MGKRKESKAKMEIIRIATEYFVEKGYSSTTYKMIADKFETSPGHVGFYFPTKEDMLAVLVRMLCEYQWKMMKKEANDGVCSVLAVCLELMVMAAACEEEEIAKDFFISAYRSSKCLAIIQQRDLNKSKEVFAEYCSDWSEEEFKEAETLVSGIEYSTLCAVDETISFEVRISGALNAIMMIYNVPEEIRKEKIQKVISMNYRCLGKKIFREFKEYVESINVKDFE